MAEIIPIKKTEQDDPLLVSMRRSELREAIRLELASQAEAKMGPDKLIDIAEAAAILSVSEDYLYHNRKTFPFVKKLGPKMLRFSFNGIQKWIASKA
jgi:predicted DNA-binding transcriptional regulator AlpA